jgi:hypothetical protein
MARTKAEQWFEDNVIENREDLLKVGELANREVFEKLSLDIASPNITIAMYAQVFKALCDVVRSKQDIMEDFELNVAGRLAIGYTTTSSEDDEKSGNFMVYINHLNSKSADTSIDDDETDTIVLCTQWNAANVKIQADVIKDAAIRGKANLNDNLDIKAANHEFIIPLFCIIHSQLIEYLLARAEELKLTELEINVAGLFTIGVEIHEERDTAGNIIDVERDIYFVPSIDTKLAFKNDAVATGKSE